MYFDNFFQKYNCKMALFEVYVRVQTSHSAQFICKRGWGWIYGNKIKAIVWYPIQCNKKKLFMVRSTPTQFLLSVKKIITVNYLLLSQYFSRLVHLLFHRLFKHLSLMITKRFAYVKTYVNWTSATLHPPVLTFIKYNIKLLFIIIYSCIFDRQFNFFVCLQNLVK